MFDIRNRRAVPAGPIETTTEDATPTRSAYESMEAACAKLEQAVEECLKASLSEVSPPTDTRQSETERQQVQRPHTITRTFTPRQGTVHATVKSIDKPQAEPLARDVPQAKVGDGIKILEGDRGPVLIDPPSAEKPNTGGSGKGSGSGRGTFHKRLGPVDFNASLKAGVNAVRHNLMIVMLFTIASNVLVLAIPVYLFQISDRVLTKPLDRHFDHADDRDRRRHRSAIHVRRIAAFRADAHCRRGCCSTWGADPERGITRFAARQWPGIPGAGRPSASSLVPCLQNAAVIS